MAWRKKMEKISGENLLISLRKTFKWKYDEKKSRLFTELAPRKPEQEIKVKQEPICHDEASI